MQTIAAKKKLSVEIWSDVACPWCYIGKRHLEAALAKFPHRDSVEVTWRAFELDPTSPRANPEETVIPYAQRLAKKHNSSEQEAQAKIDRLSEIAAKDGLDFHFEKARPGNTFDAHRLLHFASKHGLQDQMKERLFRAYMVEGEAVSHRDVLERLAGEVGLDKEKVHAMLESDEGSREVRDEEDQAHGLEITGVPFFVIDQRYGVAGAQPAEVILEAMTRAWSEIPEPRPVS